MTNGARLPRGPLRCLLPVVAASAAVAAAALPAAAVQAAAAQAAGPGAASAAAGPSGPAAPWWLTALHLPPALDGARTAGRGVTVAVLSTGVDASHPDLAGTVTSGPDFSKTGRTRGGEYWGEEGTAVASLIAGHGHGAGNAKGTTGNEGITGIAPGARILSIQVTLEYDDPLNADPAAGRRLPDAIAAGIRYAVGHGAAVIALPLDPGTLGPSDSGDPAAAGGSAAERSAVSYALARNVVLVAPAGDNGAGTNAVNYPAAYPGVIAVGATARSGGLAPFTGARSYVALTAPGAGVIPSVPVPGGMETDPAAGLTVAAAGGGYQSLASTDMSAALTAGVTALIRSRYPRLTVPEVTAALEHGAATQAGQAGQAAGGAHGELDATTALKAAAAIAAAHPAPSPSPSPSTAPTRPAASQPAAAPAVTSPAAAPADPGHLVRSLVVGLVVTAAVLIAGLVGATALTRARRRRTRRAALAGGAAASRAGPGAHGARHARGQAAPARPRAPSSFGEPAEFDPPAGFRTPPDSGPPAGFAPSAAPAAPADPGALASYAALAIPASPAPPAEPASPARPAGPPAGAGASAPAELSGVIWPSGPTQRQRPQEEPPWPPASPPGSKLSPESFLPAEPEVQPDTALAPWEKAPADFAIPPSSEDLAPWPVTNTGPMYVWNPAATTSPLSLVEDAAEDGGEDSAG